ncbi:MAG: hypothetical protein ACK4GW_11445 [Pseudorhodobacter sp.]
MAARLAVIAVLAGWTGILLAQTGTIATDRKDVRMDQSFQIGIEEGGSFTALATLNFDETNTGTLSLGDPHAETMRLIDAWTELSEADSLEVKRSRRVLEAETGEMYFATSMEEVPRGREDYPDALLTRLTQDHGFAVTGGQ